MYASTVIDERLYQCLGSWTDEANTQYSALADANAMAQGDMNKRFLCLVGILNEDCIENLSSAI